MFDSYGCDQLRRSLFTAEFAVFVRPACQQKPAIFRDHAVKTISLVVMPRARWMPAEPEGSSELVQHEPVLQKNARESFSHSRTARPGIVIQRQGTSVRRHQGCEAYNPKSAIRCAACSFTLRSSEPPRSRAASFYRHRPCAGIRAGVQACEDAIPIKHTLRLRERQSLTRSSNLIPVRVLCRSTL